MSIEAGERVELGGLELPNAGPGPDPLALDALAADHDAVVVLLQRDHFCGNCRRQVQRVAERYDEFADRDAEVVSVLPEPRERAAEWVERYDLPYPLVADPDVTAGDRFDQPTRFGFLGQLHDLVGRMPEAVVVDATGDAPTVAAVHRGTTPTDRPSVEDLLATLDDVLDGGD